MSKGSKFTSDEWDRELLRALERGEKKSKKKPKPKPKAIPIHPAVRAEIQRGLSEFQRASRALRRGLNRSRPEETYALLQDLQRRLGGLKLFCTDVTEALVRENLESMGYVTYIRQPTEAVMHRHLDGRPPELKAILHLDVVVKVGDISDLV